MTLRSLLLTLLYTLTVLLVVLAVLAGFLLLARVVGDTGAAHMLLWCLGTLVALAAADVVLLVVVLAVDRVLRCEPPESG